MCLQIILNGVGYLIAGNTALGPLFWQVPTLMGIAYSSKPSVPTCSFMPMVTISRKEQGWEKWWQRIRGFDLKLQILTV